MYHLYDLEVDEEKKVEAVRDFYAQAAKNETAFSSAERMLFFGKFRCPDLMAISDFSSSWCSILHPRIQCHLLGIRAHNVHDN